MVHYLLYNLEEDSDSYVIVLVSEEEEQDFVQEMKSLKRKAKVLLQPRRKPGKEAKRIDWGNRLSCKIFEMPEKMRFAPQNPIEGLYVADNLHFSSKNVESCLLSLDPEPHVVYRIPKLLEKLTGKNGRYAAIWQNPKRGKDGMLQDKSSYVAVGQDLAKLAEWKVLHKDDAGFWNECCWYGEHLFLAGMNKAAVIKNAMSGGQTPEIILESKENELTFPKLFQIKDRLYLYLQGKFYRWQQGRFLKKEGFNKVVYNIKTKTIGDIIPVGDEEVAFVEKNYGVSRSKEIEMMEITLLNMETGKVRKFLCFDGKLISIEDGKLLVLCTGHDMVKNKQELPVLISIDVKTGERLELPFGSMGNKELRSVYKTLEGHMVFLTIGDDRVYYPGNVEMVKSEL